MASSCKAVDAWLTDYSYRRIFYWQSSLDNAQDVLTVNYILNQTQPDFEDLRVTLNDGATLLPIWNQTTVNMVSCTFWCLFPTANTTYYLYWGNPDATPVWSESATFNSVIEDVVGAWLMNEDNETDNIIDYSGYGNDGVPTGTSIVDSSFSGEYARHFDGVDDTATVADNAAFAFTTNDFSVLLNTNVTSGNYAYFTRGNFPIHGWGTGYAFRFNGVNGVVFYMNDGSHQKVVESGAMSLGSWVSVAFVADRDGDGQLYVDGSASGAAVDISACSDITSAGNLILGDYVGTHDQVWSGHDLVFVNSTLTTDQIGNFTSSYGDVTLDAGKVLCRTWQTSEVTLWGETETYTATEEHSNTEILVAAIALIIIFTTIPIGLIYSRKQE